MAKPTRQLKLGAFIYPTGHHVAAWRHPDSHEDFGANFDRYVAAAQAAERAKFDLVFLADSSGIRGDNLDALSRVATRYTAQFEPITVLSALAAVTERIGLIATASTTYNEPYHIARKFASLDHISGGRAGWNLVTSSNEAEAHNYGYDQHMLHAKRYERAREFAAVVKGLWDSFEDDSFIRDKESGRYFDPAKFHTLDHKGEHFQVRGPLSVARPIQGHPVLVQAGASEAGRQLAAETADLVFTATPTLAEAREFYADVKQRAASAGRHPDHIKILPGISPVVGRTEQEARDKFEELQALIHPVVGLNMLGHLSADLSAYPLDGPVPDLPETNNGKSRQKLLLDMARRDNLTIRQLYLQIAGARGHQQIVGTAEQIADEIEERFRTGAADGFNIMPPILPASLDDFIALVIPELQRRGLFRTEYEGRTLRENLGLPRPVHRKQVAA